MVGEMKCLMVMMTLFPSPLHKFLYKYEARMVFLRGEGVTLKHASLQIEAV